jgi:hypothetical protein
VWWCFTKSSGMQSKFTFLWLTRMVYGMTRWNRKTEICGTRKLRTCEKNHHSWHQFLLYAPYR